MKLFRNRKSKRRHSTPITPSSPTEDPTVERSESYRIRDGILIQEVEAGLLGQEQAGSLEEEEDESLDGKDDQYDTNNDLISLGPIEQVLSSDSPDVKTESVYQRPDSQKVVRNAMGWDTEEEEDEPEGGLIWYATLVPDDYVQPDGSLKMMQAKDYDFGKKCIKPRRGGLIVKSGDFFGSLVKVDPVGEDEEEDEEDYELFQRPTRWVFSGVLNGWPGLRHLQLLKIDYQGVVPRWKTHWDSTKNSENKPTFPQESTTITGITKVRATLRAGGFTAKGWSKDSPGYVFWYQGNASQLYDGVGMNRVLYGTNILKVFEMERMGKRKSIWNSSSSDMSRIPSSPNCTKVHMISHRYATGDNTKMKDRVLYHSIVLLEWDHGQYCSVVELAWLNGLGGYNCRSNWLEDKNEPNNSFYRVLPPEMTIPWRNSLSEIRVFDVDAKNVDEFLEFMGRYEGLDKRFYDIRKTFSHATRLTFRSREHIAQYLINYCRRARTYSEIQRNCQTFAADFCAFLAGKKDVQPFHPINRVEYRNQTHYFLYESTMYGFKK